MPGFTIETTYLSCKRPGPIGFTLESGRTIPILVAVVVSKLGGQVSGFADLLGIKLAGTDGRANEGLNDALEVHRRGLFV